MDGYRKLPEDGTRIPRVIVYGIGHHHTWLLLAGVSRVIRLRRAGNPAGSNPAGRRGERRQPARLGNGSNSRYRSNNLVPGSFPRHILPVRPVVLPQSVYRWSLRNQLARQDRVLCHVWLS